MKISTLTKKGKSIFLSLFEIKKIIIDYLIKNKHITYEEYEDAYCIYDKTKTSNIEYCSGIKIDIKEKNSTESIELEVKREPIT